MDPIEQLDNVLLNLNHDDPKRINEKRFDIHKTLGFEISEKDLLLVLEKLIKDGYVASENLIRRKTTNGIETIEPGPKTYYITFDGKYFLKTGGYSQKLKDTILERERLRIENARSILRDRLLVIGSLIAGFGAVGFLCWEILKYFCA